MQAKTVRRTWQELVNDWLVANERRQAWLARKCKPPMGTAQLSRLMTGDLPATEYAIERIEEATGLSLKKVWKQQQAA